MAYKPAFTEKMQGELAFRRKKDRVTYGQAMKKIAEILENPLIGKPLHGTLAGIRRFHVGPLVITYRIDEAAHEVLFTSFEHHE
ncbi:MAG: type II toxin-antitoxin system RelE/ParE family toxin [Candidatus Marsarchaeota archaeon]|jgi:Plasmid stabilisation system protein.|nr:type II toxin-antitoxin system RelE/ParE family toxin [Candidatus Marsarchaeota archaeon]